MFCTRKEPVSSETTSYHHYFSRCDRRVFFNDEDHLACKSNEHRKAWVAERLCQLKKNIYDRIVRLRHYAEAYQSDPTYQQSALSGSVMQGLLRRV